MPSTFFAVEASPFVGTFFSTRKHYNTATAILT